MSYITNKFKKLGRKETYNHFFSTLRYSLHVITHPADGYWDLIHAKRGSYAAANHTHDDRYYTEGEVNSLVNGRVKVTGWDGTNLYLATG